MPGINILNDLSVDLMRGQVRCVLGPSGTGKSTLLKVLFGFLPALEGEISPICRNGRACFRSCRSRSICASAPGDFAAR